MELKDIQQMLVTCIDEQLRPGRDRGDRLEACRELQRILMGASVWLEGCHRSIDMETGEEAGFEEHFQGVEQAILNVRWIRV